MSAENGHGGLRPGGFGTPGGGGSRPPGTSQVSTNNVSVSWRKQETLRYLLEGYTLKQIAKLLGCSYATVINYTRDQKWREEAQLLQSNLLGRIDKEFVEVHRSKSEIMEELTTQALEKLQSMLGDENLHAGVKAKLITDVLDRDPELSRTKRLDITEKKLTLSSEDLLHALQGAKEIEERKKLKEAEELVEAEAQSVSENPTNSSGID